MPISQTAFYRTNALLLALAIAVVLAIVGLTLYLTAASERNFERVVAARELRSAAADLLSAVQDAETGQRGFLLTRESRYLEPFTNALPLIEQRKDRLAAAVADDPALVKQVDVLTERARTLVSELKRKIDIAEGGDFAGAIGEMRKGRGKELMDAVRADVTALLSPAEVKLQQSLRAQEDAINQLQIATIIGAIALLAMAGVAAWAIMSHTRDLVTARTELTALNTGLEERVQERTQALVKANEEVQRFAYIVTHYLRAPLVNIMGFTSELEATFKPVKDYVEAEPPAADALRADAKLALEEDVPEAIGFIRSSTRKMDALINAILKISREGTRSLKTEKLDVDALLQAAADAVHHQASQEGGGISVEVSAGSIVSDKLSLDQIIGNLLDNAIKYRSPDRPIQIVARAKREGRSVVIEIEDNGRGISDSDHERVFELFRRSGAQTAPGEGIGLAHVRSMARNLGGDITLRSTFGQGSTFTVRLPADLNKFKRSQMT